MNEYAPLRPFVPPKKRGYDNWIDLVKGRGRVTGGVGECFEFGRPCGGKPAALIVTSIADGGGRVCVELNIIGFGDQSVVKESDAIPF